MSKMTLRTCKKCKARWEKTYPFGKRSKARIDVIREHDEGCPHRRLK